MSCHSAGWRTDQLSPAQILVHGLVTDSIFARQQGLRFPFERPVVVAGGHTGCIGIHSNALSWESCTAAYTDWVLSAYSYFVSVGVTNLYNDGTPRLMSAAIDFATGGCITSNGSTVILASLGTGQCNLAFNTGG
jgi:hypothetical protein